MSSTMTQMVVFDLDDTLAESKQALSPEMGAALARLLEVRQVCIISGGAFGQFASQVLARLPVSANTENLHLMPTCGTRYFRRQGDDWHEIYAHELSDVEKSAATAALETRARQLGYWEPDDVVAGPRIEDRGTQITFSALGQQAAVGAKKAWDPDGHKRAVLRDAVAADLPNLEVRAGGSTSIDITRCGIDKAYGLRSLADQTGLGFDDMVFVGDRLEPGGNDYPVVPLGVPTIAVTGPADTLNVINQLLANE